MNQRVNYVRLLVASLRAYQRSGKGAVAVHFSPGGRVLKIVPLFGKPDGRAHVGRQGREEDRRRRRAKVMSIFPPYKVVGKIDTRRQRAQSSGPLKDPAA